jgi:hypothetical protein
MNMPLKVPGFLQAHPVESLLAVALLFGLLFIAADGTPPQSPVGTLVATSEKN